MPRLICLLLCALICSAAAAVAAEPTAPAATDPFGFTEDQYSSFGIVDAPYPYSGRHGCYPVGNGVIFGHLGVAEDFTLLRGLTGPGYQTRDAEGKWEVWKEGNWPDIPLKFKATAPKGSHWPVYHLGDKWTRQSIQVLRGAAMVRTVQTADFGSLYCLTYAVPDKPLIIREYVFVPTAQADPDWEFFLELGRPSGMGNGCVCELTESGPHYEDAQFIFQMPVECFQDKSGMYFQSWMPDFYAGRTLPTEAGHQVGGRQIDPATNHGTCWRTEVAIVVTEVVRPEGMMYPVHLVDGSSIEAYQRYVYPTDSASLREQAYTYWQAFSAQNLKPELPDWLGEQGVDPARLRDLLTQIPVVIETQRDAYSGAVSPLVSYHGYWVRDTSGPLLVDLANGRFEQAMRTLRYHRAVSLKRKHCGMMIPLDEDLSGLPGWKASRGRALLGPADPDESGPSNARPLPDAGDLSGIGTQAADWEGVGVEHAEVPSLIVLQHYWAWRAMQRAGGEWADKADAFITEAWPFLAHNLLGMPVDPRYGVRFHGDETYAGGALYSTYDRPTPPDGASFLAGPPLGYPNGYIPTDGWFNLDNTMLHRAAAAAFLGLPVALSSDDRAREGEARGRAVRLLQQLDTILHMQYWNGDHWAAAVSELSGRVWPLPFSNISLGCYWPPTDSAALCPLVLETGFTAEERKAHYVWCAPDVQHINATTPFSMYATGHHGANLLLAAPVRSEAARTLRHLLALAEPDGAWCEVYAGSWEGRTDDPLGGVPVEIYGRVNRIRPWESGINYCALLAGLERADGAVARDAYPLQWRNSGGYIDYPNRRVGDYPARTCVVLAQSSEQVQAARDWLGANRPELADFYLVDAALPFKSDSLRNMLQLHANGTESCLYIAPGLLPQEPDAQGFDRATFKDREFWLGREMLDFLWTFHEMGGTILPPETARRLLGRE